MCQVSLPHCLVGLRCLGFKVPLKGPPTNKNATFRRRSMPRGRSKFQIFMGKQVGQTIVFVSLGDDPSQNSNSSMAGVVDWRKLTNMGVLGHLRRFCADGPIQNARSRSISRVRSSNLAQIKAGVKLHPLQASRSQNSLFSGPHLWPKVR